MKKKPLVIFGVGEFASIAYQYFTYDSDFEVVAFCVESAFLKASTLEGLPVVAYEELQDHFPPGSAFISIPILFRQMNRLRKRFYEELKGKGYQFATYVSSKAFVWQNASIGENSFIFENCVVQPNAKVGNNCILWSGCHVGHRAVVQDHVFIAQHAVISGFCEIGEGSFVGANSTLNDMVKVGAYSLIGSGALVTKDAQGERVHVGFPARAVPGMSSFNAKLD